MIHGPYNIKFFPVFPSLFSSFLPPKTCFIRQFLHKIKHSIIRNIHSQVPIYSHGKFAYLLAFSIGLESKIPYKCLQKRAIELRYDLALRSSYNKYKLLFLLLPLSSSDESPEPRYEGLRVLTPNSLSNAQSLKKICSNVTYQFQIHSPPFSCLAPFPPFGFRTYILFHVYTYLYFSILQSQYI